jgi:transcriptional regulator with XRE-family HTH domain
MPAKIGPKKRRRIYLVEWREHRGLTQEQLANRLETAGITVSRWERGVVLLNTDTMAAIAEALGIEPEDLYHHPDQPTPNQLLRDQSKEVGEQALSLIRAIRR